jgi:hypothetical protein
MGSLCEDPLLARDLGRAIRDLQRLGVQAAVRARLDSDRSPVKPLKAAHQVLPVQRELEDLTAGA